MYIKSSYVVAATLSGMFGSCGLSTDTNFRSTDADAEYRHFNDPVSGAIFTTLADGSLVNDNIYPAKEDIYLDGGPGLNAPAWVAGLPEGDYYFQVTDPSGEHLLSSDHISCRKLHVNDEGVISRIYRGTNYALHSAGWVKQACLHRAGADIDRRERGAITVRLFPFDHTPDDTGMYKVWLTPVGQYLGDPDYMPIRRKDPLAGEQWQAGNFYGFAPTHSKTDNFKLEISDQRPQLLSMHEFHDANANGAWDDDEREIAGWEVMLNDPLGASNRYFTPFELVVERGRWAVLERSIAGAVLTASIVDGTRTSAYPEAGPLAWLNVVGVSGERHEIVYGEVGVGTVEACMFYDADGDAEVDGEEVGVAGWRFALEGTDIRGQSYGPITQISHADGCTQFNQLLPGRYTIKELSLGGSWMSSGPDARVVDIRSELVGSKLLGTQVSATFTNYCQGRAMFANIGYWRSKPGLHELRDASIDYLNTLSPFKRPSPYSASSDEPFDGKLHDGRDVVGARAAGGSARAELSQFLLEADAGVDTREHLAQQLLAFVLNVHQRVEDIGASIQRPGGAFISADELISEAIAAWEHGDKHARAELVQLLDALNNNNAVSFIYDRPCALP